MKIKTGDMVVVITGQYKGAKGKVLKALPKTNQVVVEGVNARKKHVKPNQSNTEGKIVDINAPIDVSNVALVDPKTDKRTKVGYKLQDGKKVRFAKASGTILK